MREQIDTIPVNEAFASDDECPFCYLERMSEQRTIRYVLGPGASYMEPEVRGVTDTVGFCREHYQKMYDFGNALGNALIMQSYLGASSRNFRQRRQALHRPAKSLSLASGRIRKKAASCNGPRKRAAPATSAAVTRPI